MSRPDFQAQARELVARTTKAQGIPFHVTDPATLRRVSAVVATRQRPATRRAS